MRLCVFCGSAPGNQPEYLAAAQQLGTALAKAGIGLVYGGAQVGVLVNNASVFERDDALDEQLLALQVERRWPLAAK